MYNSLPLYNPGYNRLPGIYILTGSGSLQKYLIILDVFQYLQKIVQMLLLALRIQFYLVLSHNFVFVFSLTQIFPCCVFRQPASSRIVAIM